MKSVFGKINWKDMVRAAFVAGITVIGTNLYTTLSMVPPTLPTTTEFLLTLKLAGWTAFAYLVKNLITNSEDQLLKKEPKEEPAKLDA